VSAALAELILPGSIALEVTADTKAAALEELVGLLDAGRPLADRALFTEAVLAREALSTTGLGEGIAIPHGKSDGIAAPAIAFARSSRGIDWGSPDGTPAHLLFLIGVPEAAAGDEHLVILAKLARTLMRDEFRQRLLDAATVEDVLTILGEIAS